MLISSQLSKASSTINYFTWCSQGIYQLHHFTFFLFFFPFLLIFSFFLQLHHVFIFNLFAIYFYSRVDIKLTFFLSQCYGLHQVLGRHHFPEKCCYCPSLQLFSEVSEFYWEKLLKGTRLQSAPYQCRHHQIHRVDHSITLPLSLSQILSIHSGPYYPHWPCSLPCLHLLFCCYDSVSLGVWWLGLDCWVWVWEKGWPYMLVVSCCIFTINLWNCQECILCILCKGDEINFPKQMFCRFTLHPAYFLFLPSLSLSFIFLPH